MGQPPHPNRPGLSRRRALATIAGGGGAALLGACTSGSGSGAADPSSSPAAAPAASASLRIDFGAAAFFPLLKSKIGIGRALDSSQLLDTLPYMDQIRPALYDAEIRFPDTGWASLTPYPFEVGADGRVTVLPNDFLNAFFSGLRRRNIEIMVQLEGGPKQWWNYPGAQRPHLFPVPTDLPAAAEAIGMWAEQYSAYRSSWCVWNEPTHNLTGSADLKSINQLMDVYRAYTGAITRREPQGQQGLFGMASLITPSVPVRRNLGDRSYVQAMLDQLRAQRRTGPRLPFDYLTLNNYGQDLTTLFDGARDGLGADFNTVPLVQAQSGVFKPGVWEKSGGTSLEAARAMTALQTALRVPDLQTFTFSGWMPHLITFKNGAALQLPLFNALKLYARMPDRRSPVHGTLPSGLGVMASGDEHRSSVMVWNETDRPYTVELRLSGVAAAGRSGARLTVHTIDSEHGSPLEHSGNDFAPTHVEPLGPSSRSLTRTVTVAGPGIVHVEIGTASHPDLDRGALSATLIRKHSYADRMTDRHGRTSVRGNAYGCYDAARAIAYVGVEGQQGTAVVGAEYSGLPDTLPVAIRTDMPAAEPASREALLGIRVDYVSGGEVTHSVLWHGDIFDADRTTALPWGNGGPTANALVEAAQLNAQAEPGTLVLPLAAHAPADWSETRQAILSFWLDSPGPHSQARFVLG